METSDGLSRPLIKDGRFHSPWATWLKPSWLSVLKYLATSKDLSGIPSSTELDQTLPITPLDENTLKDVPENGMRVTWLGHASVLVQFDSVTLLTDPVFSERASPFSFMGPKRYRNAPGTVKDLPKIDAVVISHNHYDHLDFNTVKSLNERFGADLHWFVPMGLEKWMRSSGCESVTEMMWWDEVPFPRHPEVTVAFTPSQHWCKRGISDDNTVLWGSFSILGPRYRFFFAGDTGYCEAFKEIGKKYGPFHLAAIPIGAYEPRWFMKPQHVDPAEAVQIHLDIEAKRSLGIHWGTFKLTYEHYLEPPKKMSEIAKENGLESNEFFVLKHGESHTISSES